MPKTIAGYAYAKMPKGRWQYVKDKYGNESIKERHRHRYEVNPEYVGRLEEAGAVFSGQSPDGKLMEIMELPEKVHPFFVATQFHPEFTSSPLTSHPLFQAFIQASLKNKSK